MTKKKWLKSKCKSAGLVAGILLFLYSLVKVVGFIGFYKVLAGLYLLIGFMVSDEMRRGSKFNILSWLMVVFWLPAIIIGFLRKGWSLVDSVNEEVAEELDLENE